MRRQRGMTLIEVMVAMLVLSIAMIGGISFFTSAYRINYSYLESANRLDHALRYVERLKVQRRNYPTKGYFPNIGGNGYTVFFVNSESNDLGPEPYYYENFTTSVVKILAKNKVNFLSYAETNPQQQIYDSSAGGGYNAGIAGSYTREVYVPQPWHTYNSNINSWKRVTDEYPKKDALQQRLDEMSNGNYVKIYESGTAPNILKTYFRYSYNDTDPLQVGNVANGDFDAYIEVPYSYLVKSARDNWNSVTPPKVYQDFAFSTIPSWLPNGNTPLYAYYFKERRNNATNPYPTFAYYYGEHTASNLYLTSGAELEGGESSGLGSEILTAHSLRFYTQMPTVGSGENYEDITLRQMAAGNTFPAIKNGPDGSYCRISKAYEAPDKADVKMPLSTSNGGYGSHITHIAKVYTNQSGREKVVGYYYWYNWNWPGGPGTPNTGGAEISYPTSSPYYSAQNIFRFYFDSKTAENNKRMTKVRRSVYISIYPVPTEQDAKSLRDVLATTYKSDINGAVNYAKSLATPGNSNYKGYRIITIPFLQLFANNEESTLCERLD